MRNLQNKWYDALVGLLPLESKTAQLLQPARLLPCNDTGLWASLDVLPPEALTFNTTLDLNREFSSEYVAMAGSLQLPQPLMPPTTILQADFSGTRTQLDEMLQNSQGVSVDFHSSNPINDPAVNAWTHKDSNLFGLWAGSSSRSEIAGMFAASRVSVQLRAVSYVVWPALPGDWFSSALLNIAFTNFGSPPWPADSRGWQYYFGLDGQLNHFLSSILVLDNVIISVESDAQLSADQQLTLKSRATDGLWPFYLPAGDGVNLSNHIGDAGFSYELAIGAGNPIVAGGNVLDASRYLGIN